MICHVISLKSIISILSALILIHMQNQTEMVLSLVTHLWYYRLSQCYLHCKALSAVETSSNTDFSD